jgi:hypothetical protein
MEDRTLNIMIVIVAGVALIVAGAIVRQLARRLWRAFIQATDEAIEDEMKNLRARGLFRRGENRCQR